MGKHENAHYDVVIVGAGFSGLYMLHKTRELGVTACLLEAGSDVGGTWYWNQYPGARCDVESMDYSFSFSPELEQEWSWKERYPAQPEIQEYLRHVARKCDLYRSIRFDERVTAAHYDDDAAEWTLRTESGGALSAWCCVMATGCLSAPRVPEITGLEDFTGDLYYTSNWPAGGVDFSGKRVGVIGTGSSGIQVIPIVAEEADALTVFQRTPAFEVPAHNGPLTGEREREVKATYRQRRRKARASAAGMDRGDAIETAEELGEQGRRRELEDRWQVGGSALLGSFADLMVDQRANDYLAEFIHERIREIVDDPAVAEKLIPTEYPVGSKRICVGTNYYETFNRDNVELVSLRETPLERATSSGVRTSAGDYEVDALVLATGFDAMTGALTRMDIRGSGGNSLAEKWSEGAKTYLGLGVAGFPNLFTVTGPGSPSVLTNMVTAIEQHVEWISTCLRYLLDNDYTSVEATSQAEQQWVDHVNEVADTTLYPNASSWYVGANVPGKKRVFTPYAGGLVEYEKRCEEVAARAYEGFVLK